VARSSTDGRLALAMFAVVLVAYHASYPGNYGGSDAVPNTLLPVSILGVGRLDFSPIEAPFMFVWSAKTPQGGETHVGIARWNQLIPGTEIPAWRYKEAGLLKLYRPRYFVVPTIRHRSGSGEPLFVGAFGPAAGLTAVPVAAAAKALGLPLQSDPAVAYGVARLTAELLAAASVAIVFLIARVYTTRLRALVLAAAYGFGTCVWTISANQLWQQTPELFFLSLGVLCLVRGESMWARGLAAGLAFSAAAACRPTAAIVALVAAAYLVVVHRRAAAAFLLSALPLAIALLGYNAYYFGSPLDFGQLAAGASVAYYKTGSSDVWQTPPWLGAAGLLFSPSRGLLVYTPFLAAAFAGAVLAWKEPRYAALRFLTVAVPLLWLPAFMWFDWWGGWTYGYRPIVDTTPLLAVLCIPALESICVRAAWRYAFVAAIGWSVFVQFLGVLTYRPTDWNARRIDVDGAAANVDLPQYRSRLWSWSDWQIGFLIAKLPALYGVAR
jgi:hypothetical protein